jgi:hypothetical protein
VANQVIPRLTGDDYQHLYSWYHVLSLLRPKDCVKRVRVEDEEAGSVDDVTLFHETGTDHRVEVYEFFFQVKYHESHYDHYSSEALLERKGRGRSLLQKFWDTWKRLRADDPARRIELYLVSNWSWNPDADKIGHCISGRDDRLTSVFFDAGPASDIGKERDRWRQHLGADLAGFATFAKSLNFRLGEGSWRQLKELVAQRMEHFRLKHDENALAISSGIFRDWIRRKQGDITIEVLERILKERDLYAPDSTEACATVHLNTIKERIFDLHPDFALDWRTYFVGAPDSKGHQVQDPGSWNSAMLPELRSIAHQVGTTTSCRLVRARGLARLSAWFAFGYVFSEVAGYSIEVQQQAEHWRTDVDATQDFKLVATEDSIAESDDSEWGLYTTVACGISVTGSLDDDVRKHLRTIPEVGVAALQLIRPERELGRDCLRSAGDVVALARGVKTQMREFVNRRNAMRLLLYYFGPLRGACFIGHQLNAVCRQIQIMEDQQPGYALAFLLE